MEVFDGGRGQVSCGGGGGPAELPEDFIGHPISNAGEIALVEEEGLEGESGMAGEGGAHLGGGELLTAGGGRHFAPPRRGRFAFVDAESAEHAGIAEGEGGGPGEEDEVIVPAGRVVGREAEHFPAHAEMTTEPDLSGKGEEHLFAMGVGDLERGSGEGGGQGFGGFSAEDAGPGVEVHTEDLRPQAGVPDFAIIFHFGEFRHGEGQHSNDRRNASACISFTDSLKGIRQGLRLKGARNYDE